MLNILQNMYTLVLSMDILFMHHHTVEINFYLKTGFDNESCVGVQMSHLRWGPMSRLSEPMNNNLITDRALFTANPIKITERGVLVTMCLC